MKKFGKLTNEHAKFLEENYGDTPVNFGWVTDEDEPSICSKVYKSPREYVTSFIASDDGKIYHEVLRD